MKHKKKNHPRAKKLKDKINKAKKNFHPKDIPYAHLMPFKKMMIRQLDNKNIQHTGELHDIAQKFYHVIIKKQNFTGNRTNFGHWNIVEELASGVVKAIIEFIKQLIQKKKAAKLAGVPDDSTPAEKEMTEDAETGVKEADDDLDDGTGTGDSIVEYGSWLARLLDRIFPARAQHK